MYSVACFLANLYLLRFLHARAWVTRVGRVRASPRARRARRGAHVQAPRARAQRGACAGAGGARMRVRERDSTTNANHSLTLTRA